MVLESTAVLSEAWAKLRDWASVAGRGLLLLSGSVAHASLETAVFALLTPYPPCPYLGGKSFRIFPFG